MLSNKEKVRKLLKGIETGDPDAALVVNENKYIQHNPHTREGNIGLAELFKQIAKTGPRVNMIRAFEDKDFVFAHMEYNFSTLKVAFEVFRFEDGFAVEHWDNMQPMQQAKASGRSMLDGSIVAEDHHLTEFNRERVLSFVTDILLARKLALLPDYICQDNFIQHSPLFADGIVSLRSALSNQSKNEYTITYVKIHRILAEGNFALSVCEGLLDGQHSSFYDLFRLAKGKIVEHWDTIEPIPPRNEWKNENGKF
jgi:predicted SnoaL-like aldol condensation-catalyzing enzyme